MGKLTDKFVKRGTGTSESYKEISTVPFPVLTICPSYPYKDERIRYHGLDLKKDLQVRIQQYSIPTYYRLGMQNVARETEKQA